MLKVYGQNDMFSKAKELFEEANKAKSGPHSSLNDKFGYLIPDGFTYSLMLEASASAHQWEYFEYVYKEMALCGYQLDQSKLPILLVEASRAGKVSYIYIFFVLMKLLNTRCPLYYFSSC